MHYNVNTFLKNSGKEKGKNYFSNYFSEGRTPWFTNIKTERNFVTTVNRIRSEHYNLAASLARINIVTTPKCDCEYELQVINHILW